jgi:hypothetical protein
MAISRPRTFPGISLKKIALSPSPPTPTIPTDELLRVGRLTYGELIGVMGHVRDSSLNTTHIKNAQIAVDNLRRQYTDSSYQEIFKDVAKGIEEVERFHNSVGRIINSPHFLSLLSQVLSTHTTPLTYYQRFLLFVVIYEDMENVRVSGSDTLPTALLLEASRIVTQYCHHQSNPVSFKDTINDTLSKWRNEQDINLSWLFLPLIKAFARRLFFV